MSPRHAHTPDATMLLREAERCERLYAASFNPSLSAELLQLARQLRSEAARAIGR